MKKRGKSDGRWKRRTEGRKAKGWHENQIGNSNDNIANNKLFNWQVKIGFDIEFHDDNLNNRELIISVKGNGWVG